MNARRVSATLTTDASGDVTGYIPSDADIAAGKPKLSGRLFTLQYIKTDFANSVDFVVTLENSSEAVLTEADVNASATRAPRQPTHGVTDGAAALYAAAGTGVFDHIVLANDRLKIVVSSGGDTKTGEFAAVVG